MSGSYDGREEKRRVVSSIGECGRKLVFFVNVWYVQYSFFCDRGEVECFVLFCLRVWLDGWGKLTN